MSSEPEDRDLRGTIVAAEVSVVEDDLDAAEAALLNAVSLVRKQRQEGRRE